VNKIQSRVGTRGPWAGSKCSQCECESNCNHVDAGLRAWSHHTKKKIIARESYSHFYMHCHRCHRVALSQKSAALIAVKLGSSTTASQDTSASHNRETLFHTPGFLLYPSQAQNITNNDGRRDDYRQIVVLQRHDDEQGLQLVLHRLYGVVGYRTSYFCRASILSVMLREGNYTGLRSQLYMRLELCKASHQ
jgi:hypothetical protein